MVLITKSSSRASTADIGETMIQMLRPMLHAMIGGLIVWMCFISGVFQEHSPTPHFSSTRTKTARDQESRHGHPLIGQPLPKWQEGFLDIHHIHSGVAVSTFTVFPDGTTMLTDAGDQDLTRYVNKRYKAATFRDEWKGRLSAAEPWPNPKLRPSQQISEYLLAMWPHNDEKNTVEETKIRRPLIDYMLNTHLHSDHLGQLYEDSRIQPKSQRGGDFYLTGITEIGEHFDFGLFLDRGYPKYDFPYDLLQHWVPKRPTALGNYIKFIQHHVAAGRSRAENFEVGSDSQIVLLRNKKWNVTVRNIKSALDVSPALPNNRTVYHIPGELWPNRTHNPFGKFDENEMSNAYVLQFGNFRYYEGGDQEYHPKVDTPQGIPADVLEMDTVSPTAQMAGKVDVATLNHHGHGVRPAFCNIMDPKVLILQGWCSDHMPEHPLHMLMEDPRPNNTRNNDKNIDNGRHLFATQVFNTKLQELGPLLARHFESVLGHVVIRVSPPLLREQQEYWVYILNGQRIVTAVHGPYYPENEGAS